MVCMDILLACTWVGMACVELGVDRFWEEVEGEGEGEEVMAGDIAADKVV